MSAPPVGARPQASEATPKAASPKRKRRRRPKRSAREPPRSSSAESESRYAFTIHSCPFRLTWRSRLIAGSARNTTVSSRIVMFKPMMAATNVQRLRVASVILVLGGVPLGPIRPRSGLPPLRPDVERCPDDETERDRRVHQGNFGLQVHARIHDRAGEDGRDEGSTPP